MLRWMREIERASWMREYEILTREREKGWYQGKEM
jgi:hypothetical protein